jgi:hypothetical protein
MLKNTVMSLPDKFIVFLGRTLSGHNHDYSMLQQELPPELDWFTDINVLVDLGYLGIQADYRGDQIEIPAKKPRKSKKKSNSSTERGAKGCQYRLESGPHLCRACDWRHEALQHFGPWLPQSQSEL